MSKNWEQEARQLDDRCRQQARKIDELQGELSEEVVAIQDRDEEIGRLRAALAFYANPHNWEDRPGIPQTGCSGDEGYAVEDEGKRAREALDDATPPAWVCSSCLRIERWTPEDEHESYNMDDGR